MKKIFALVLALVMVLCAVSALAGPSKQNENIGGATTNEPEVTMTKVDDTEETTAIKEKIQEANENGNPLDGIPEDVRSQIPEGRTKINEMDTYILEGDDGTSDQILLIFKFETPYEDGQAVTVLFGIAPAGAETIWLVKEGKGNADGDVEVLVTRDELNKISNNPFVVIPVSE